MNRRSVLKNILTIVAAPSVLTKLELNSPLVQPKAEGYIGIIPSLMSDANVQYYEAGSLTIEDIVRIYEQTGHLMYKSRERKFDASY